MKYKITQINNFPDGNGLAMFKKVKLTKSQALHQK